MNHPFRGDIAAYVRDLMEKELGDMFSEDKKTENSDRQRSEVSSSPDMKNSPFG